MVILGEEKSTFERVLHINGQIVLVHGICQGALTVIHVIEYENKQV